MKHETWLADAPAYIEDERWPVFLDCQCVEQRHSGLKYNRSTYWTVYCKDVSWLAHPAPIGPSIIICPVPASCWSHILVPKNIHSISKFTCQSCSSDSIGRQSDCNRQNDTAGSSTNRLLDLKGTASFEGFAISSLVHVTTHCDSN